jgi:zinc transporter 1
MIASVHIHVNLPPTDRTKRYHQIARAIRTCLHAYGIHSSTIQPEFANDLPLGPYVPSDDGSEDSPLLQDGGKAQACLFECVGGTGECESRRCCDVSDVKKGKNGTNYGTGP